VSCLERAHGAAAAVLCGDFNSLPDSGVYAHLTRAAGFRSAYAAVAAARGAGAGAARAGAPRAAALEPALTNFNARDGFKGTLDYVFVRAGVPATATARARQPPPAPAPGAAGSWYAALAPWTQRAAHAPAQGPSWAQIAREGAARGGDARRESGVAVVGALELPCEKQLVRAPAPAGAAPTRRARAARAPAAPRAEPRRPLPGRTARGCRASRTPPTICRWRVTSVCSFATAAARGERRGGPARTSTRVQLRARGEGSRGVLSSTTSLHDICAIAQLLPVRARNMLLANGWRCLAGRGALPFGGRNDSKRRRSTAAGQKSMQNLSITESFGAETGAEDAACCPVVKEGRAEPGCLAASRG